MTGPELSADELDAMTRIASGEDYGVRPNLTITLRALHKRHPELVSEALADCGVYRWRLTDAGLAALAARGLNHTSAEARPRLVP